MNSADICARVRHDAAQVAAQAGQVVINTEAISAYVEKILSSYPLITELGGEMHLASGDAETRARYILALDSINFGSGYFETAQSAGVALEYDLVAKGLKRFFLNGQWADTGRWPEVKAKDFHDMLDISSGLHPSLDHLMAIFADHLRQAGLWLQQNWNGSVMAVIQAADHSAVRLAGMASGIEGFNDVAGYAGREVAFFKRAQIFASDIQLGLKDEPVAAFHDMDRLTIFADNMVPHVLRYDGILSYAPELSHRIEAGGFLQAGEPAEIEIRACAIHAVELMRDSACASGRNVTAVNLDHLLWHRGYEPDIYAKPKHKTETCFY